MENQEDIAFVRSIDGRTVTVELIKTGSCDTCAMSGICGANDKTVIHTIKTDRKLAVGNKVRVQVSPGMRIFSSFIIFLFPILSMVCFYLGAKLLVHTSENIAILLSFVGLLLSGIVVYAVDKIFADRISVKIIEKVSA
ncbi:MAG: SoxR reducing system RseC family protein [Candidatus Cloacimonetes bacterium]|nr:SoxR reducing system RseC family protein [Candidatus Cloacimonadota bacterium]